jgi:hypothetical protein
MMNTTEHTDIPTPVLTRTEVENLLADYAFGELEAPEAARLEASLPSYPDLQEELLCIQESFAAVEGEIEALERTNAQRLRNLSIHVQDRLKKDAERTIRRWQWFRILVPSLAVAAAIAVVVVPNSISDYVRTRFGAGANSENTLALQADEIKALEESQALTVGLLDVDATLNDKALADAIDDQLSAQENKAASRMLHKETMKTLARNTSAFQDYFDNSAEMQHVTEEDVANVAAALTEM